MPAGASALRLVPRVLPTRATRALVRGRGPQGGEAYFLLWLVLLAWVWTASSAAFVAAGLVLGATPAVKSLL